jgi:hypothetical protein
MEGERDLRIIDRVAIEKWEENRNFRSFLKQSVYEIDKNLLNCGSGF